jgi:arsenate reductase
MMRKRVLFVCIHNSARSQMAEAFLDQACSEEFEASSAGLEPTTINPLVVEVMKEVGIDLSSKRTQDVWTLAKRGTLFAFVISVCDEERSAARSSRACASGSRGASPIRLHSRAATNRS